MMYEDPLLETSRLILTFPNKKQIEQYYNDIIGTNIFDTILWNGPKDKLELFEYWENNKTNDPNNLELPLSLAIIEKKTNYYIGGAALRPVNSNPHIIDIGYALAQKFHGQGYATEAIRELVNIAFEMRNAQRIFAAIFLGNTASRKVVEKIGFIYEGTLRRSVNKNNTWLDEWLLAITKPDWEKLEARKS